MCAECLVCVQWARNNPAEWESIPASQWASQPNRGVPVGVQGGNDNLPGWIHSICIQGVVLANYDHYAVDHYPDGVRATIWTDDPVDFPPEEFAAEVWEFPHLAPDPTMGNVWNTRQRLTVYAAVGARERFLPMTNIMVDVRDWSEFTEPDPAITRHGVWVEDAKYLQHQNQRSARPWYGWTQGVPQGEHVAGRVVT